MDILEILEEIQHKALKNENFQIFEEIGVTLCMECGCCSYVCPTRQPLVEHNKLSKVMLFEEENR